MKVTLNKSEAVTLLLFMTISLLSNNIDSGNQVQLFDLEKIATINSNCIIVSDRHKEDSKYLEIRPIN